LSRVPIVVSVALAFVLAGCAAEAPPPPPVAPPPPAPTAVDPPPAPSPAPEPPPAPAPPLAGLQLASLRTAADAINAHDAKRYASVFTPNAIHRESAAPDIVGREGIAARMELLFAAFPDFKLSFGKVWQKGNVVVATWRWNGTDTGGFMGKKPTSRPAGLEGITIAWTNDDGMVREVRVYEDGETVVEQLDARPHGKTPAFRPPPAGAPPAMEVIVGGDGAADPANLRVAKIFYDALENKKETDILALFNNDSTADDYAMSPTTARGLKDWKALVHSWTTALPDSSQEPLVSQIAVGDYVISERIVRGTQRGPFGHVAATGVPVSLHMADILELKDGKIARFSTWSNTLELLSQVTHRAKRP
jgi:predicted ester cyclase